MAPVESAGPMLTTQRPTLTSAAVAFAVRVHVVSPVVVTLTVEVSDSPGRVDSISNPVPSTAVTWPKPPIAPRRGASPDGAPSGGLPCSTRGPSPWPRMPPVHEPPTAVMIRTVAAATVVVSSEDWASRSGIAATQSPTFRSVAAAVTCWVNAVFEVHVTATWPPWPCTWAVEPDTAATLPEPPGPPWPPGPPCPAARPAAVLAGDRAVRVLAVLAVPVRPAPGQARAARARQAATTAYFDVFMAGSLMVVHSLSFIRCGVRRWG